MPGVLLTPRCETSKLTCVWEGSISHPACAAFSRSAGASVRRKRKRWAIMLVSPGKASAAGSGARVDEVAGSEVVAGDEQRRVLPGAGYRVLVGAVLVPPQ